MRRPVASLARDARNRGLARRANGGDVEARTTLIAENLSLVYAPARWFADRTGRDGSLALSDAMLGLVEAAHGYDPETYSFATYARSLILGAMRAASRDDHLIAISDELSRSSAHARKTASGQASFARLQDFARAARSVTSLVSDPVDTREPEPEPDVRLALLPMLLGRIDDRSRTVLARRFGLDGDPEGLAEIGADLGVSKERVRQIQETALAKLRAHASRLNIA